MCVSVWEREMETETEIGIFYNLETLLIFTDEIKHLELLLDNKNTSYILHK